MSQSILIAACGPMVLIGTVLTLPGCSPSSQAKMSKEIASQRPSADQLALAVNPPYASTPAARHECLGRVTFDVAADIQWGVRAPGGWNSGLWRFTEYIHGGQDAVWVGDMKMVVMAPAELPSLASSFETRDAEKKNAISEYRNKIRIANRRMAGLNELLDDPSKNINNEDLSSYPAHIRELKTDIADAEEAIADITKYWQPMDVGLPDSRGYKAGPNMYAYVYRDSRLYTFLSTGGEGSPSPDERKKILLDTLKNFKFRSLYDVPKERGICIPYGFIPDDGTTPFRIEVSMRYADRPGVIYTIGSGIIGQGGIVGSEPALFKAAARVAAGSVGGVFRDGVKRTLKIIGPRTAYIGALPAQQGGISLNTADAGKPVLPNYSVYTGYGGWWGSQVLPYITVDMRSFTMEQERTLKENPPPFEESLERLDALLKSIRLRPTTVPMPELAPRAVAP